MKQKDDQPASTDHELFKQALGDVVPLPASNRVQPTQVLPHTKQRNPKTKTFAPVITDTLSDSDVGGDAAVEFLRPSMSRLTLRNLKRGRWVLQDSLDLHGLNSDTARMLLLEFLHNAMEQGFNCVSVIHGKGWQADGREGILKSRVRRWLPQHPGVLAFCEAPQNAGGGGAVWVLLKMAAPEGRP
jgi:DNA-nicking Smr family endonuclease